MTVRTDNPDEVGVHVFERAKLGVAPFRCVGVATVIFRASPDSPAQPGGTCDYCGTGIMIHCYIKGRDGKQFKVGSDCVARTGDAGLIKSYKARPEVRAAAKAARDGKAKRVFEEGNALLGNEANRAKLASMPALNPASENLLASFDWIWARCGAAGRNRWLKKIKAALAEQVPA